MKIYITAGLVFTSSDVGSPIFKVANNQVTVLAIPGVQTDNTSIAICDLIPHIVRISPISTILLVYLVIQKISSVCEYCRYSAAVTMVRMRAEIFHSLSRHGRNLQTFEQCLRIVLCVYNV